MTNLQTITFSLNIHRHKSGLCCNYHLVAAGFFSNNRCEQQGPSLLLTNTFNSQAGHT